MRPFKRMVLSPIQDPAVQSALRGVNPFLEDISRLVGANFTKGGTNGGGSIIVPVSSLPVHTHEDATQGGNTLGYPTKTMNALGDWLFGGRIAMGSPTPSGRLYVLNSAAVSEVLATLQAAVGQTGDVLRMLNSSGRVLAKFDKQGTLTIGNPTDVTVPSIIYMGGFDPAIAFSGVSKAIISWGDNSQSVGPPVCTTDYIGCNGARLYTYKDVFGQFDNGYGQDGLDAWVLVSDESVTYSIFTGGVPGFVTPFLRAQWDGNGDMRNFGVLSIIKNQGAVTPTSPELRLFQASGFGGTAGKYIALAAPSSVTATYHLTLPAAAPTTTSTVRVTSAGVVSFVDTPPLASTKSGAAVNATAQSADIATTNLLAAGHTAGMYRVSVVLECTTADATAGTVTSTLGWTDDAGATTQATAAQALTATGRTVLSQTMYSTGAAAITYNTTHTGAYNAGRYALRVRVEFLG